MPRTALNCDLVHLRRRLLLFDPQRGDLIAVSPQHLETVAVKSEALTGLGNGLRFVNDQARHGDGLFVRQIPIHRPVQVADRHHAININRTVRLWPHALHGDIVFVFDVADDLLKDILKRD